MKYQILSITQNIKDDNLTAKIEFIKDKQKTILTVEATYEYLTMYSEMSKWHINPNMIDDQPNLRKIKNWIINIIIPNFKLEIADIFSQSQWFKYYRLN